MTDLRTILYIAAAETAAHDGAAALERVAAATDDLELVVEGATDFETIRTRAPDVDCVVFAETPTTAAGAHLLEVADACRGTPLVLYTDGAYGPTAARSTDGVDGYIRRDRADDENEDGLTHLVDEIVWVSHGRNRGTDRKALPEADTGSAPDLLESLPEGVFTVDRRGRLTYANEWVGDLLDIDATAIRDVPLEALEAAGTLSTSDLEVLEDAIDRVVRGDDDHVTAAATVTAAGTSTSLVLRVGAREGGSETENGNGTENGCGTEAVVTVRPADSHRQPDVSSAEPAAPERTATNAVESVAVPAPQPGGGGEAEAGVGTRGEAEMGGGTETGVEAGVATQSPAEAPSENDSDDEGEGADEDERDGKRQPRGRNGSKNEAKSDIETDTTEQPAQTHPNRDRPEHATIATLHEAIDDIVTARADEQLFERTLEAVEAVLGVDQCWLLVVDDGCGCLVPAAESDGAPAPLVESQSGALDVAAPGDDTSTSTGSDGGRDESSQSHSHDSETSVAARTLRTGTAAVFENGGHGRQHRSLLSVPIGDMGVFQAVADDTETFDALAREVVELLVQIVATVHTRIHAEAVLDAGADASANRDHVSELFANVPDPVVHYEFVDGEPIVRDVNPPFESVFGYDRETILGENIDDYIVPSGLTAEAETLNSQLRTGENDQLESRRRTATGIRDFLITCVPLELSDHDGGGFAIYSNVTERKRRERELAAKNDRLEEFTSIVGHDLRNPLNVARGYLELANETGDEEHFEEVDAAHERMGTLLDQLLALARRGDMIADTEPVAIHDSARRAWDGVETDAAELVLECDDILDADRSRLTEALENLIRNAVEHGFESESEPEMESEPETSTNETESESEDENQNEDENAMTIRIGATDDGFFVADDGVGIPSADRETIFDSGYTTADDGTGYGLRIVEQIIQAHGWTISVTDSADGGARFDVRDVSDTGFESVDSDTTFLESDVDA